MTDIVDSVVEQFRDAALGLVPWERPLGLLTAATGGHMAQLAGVSRSTTLTVNLLSGVSADQVADYFAAHGDDPAVNPRTLGLLTAAPGRCLTDADFLKDAPPPPIYDGLFRRLDIPHAAQVRLDVPPDMTMGLIVLRPASTGAHGRQERDLLTLAAPGISGAVRTALALGAVQDRSVVDTAETLSGAAILLDCDRRIVSLSPAAETVVRSGRFLALPAGRLVAAHPAGADALDRAFALALLPVPHMRQSSALALLANAGAEPLPVEVHPLPTRLSGPISHARVLLTMRVAQPPGELRSAALVTAYALTAAEAHVALALAAGHGLAQIAAHRGTSVGTVRSQLKIAFEKTGTRRQAELAVLVRSFL